MCFSVFMKYQHQNQQPCFHCQSDTCFYLKTVILVKLVWIIRHLISRQNKTFLLLLLLKLPHFYQMWPVFLGAWRRPNWAPAARSGLLPFVGTCVLTYLVGVVMVAGVLLESVGSIVALGALSAPGAAGAADTAGAADAVPVSSCSQRHKKQK